MANTPMWCCSGPRMKSSSASRRSARSRRPMHQAKPFRTVLRSLLQTVLWVRIANEIRMHLRRERKTPLTLSMQEPIQTSKDGSHLTVLDVVPDDFLLDEDCEFREESSRLRTLVQQLTGRERQVILLRYGLSGQPPLTQQQVAQLLGISRSYVSRIEKAAVQELRAQLDPAR
ncbi:hypothetical protein B5G03_02325 [Gemmiger sp. An50]|nr:hypothetical protein B5G03_02325 [Gemmiger sp. An50]